MIDEIDIIMRENSRCFGCKEKTHEKQMLEKYPNMYKVESCHICKADLRYLHRIHRINFEWYCDKCYRKKRYIFPNLIEVKNRKGDCSKGICPIVNGICLIGHKNICCNCFHNPKKREIK